MKTESTAKYVARLALTLTVITLVVAVCLAAVNTITAPEIARINAEKTQQAIEAVLPGGGETVPFTDETGIVSQVYASDLGFAVEVCPNGFDGGITMMVGVSPEGNVLGISIIEQTETAGLGAVAAADTSAGQAFRQQFVGLSGSVSVTKDGGSVDALTGATNTSRAICTGINAALQCVASLG